MAKHDTNLNGIDKSAWNNSEGKKVEREGEDNSIRMLLTGPASAIRAVSRRGWRRLNGSNSTGFPHPKPATRRRRVPRGSRCFAGLSVRRSCRRGVGSPSLSAIQACANSWNVSAETRAIISRRKRKGLENKVEHVFIVAGCIG